MERPQVISIGFIYKYQTERKQWISTAPRSYHCLSYQVCGHYDHSFPTGILPVKSDTLFFINQNDPYSVKCASHGYSFCITFAANTDLPSLTVDCKDDPRIYNFFRKLMQLKDLSLESNYCLAMTIIYELLAVIYQKKELKLSNKTDKADRIRNYISAHYSEANFQTGELAQKLDISPKHLRNLFKKKYGTTPTQYLIELRLNTAAELLSDHNLAIGEIAEMTGFSDVYYFSKLFKKRFSISPSQYRITSD